MYAVGDYIRVTNLTTDLHPSWLGRVGRVTQHNPAATEPYIVEFPVASTIHLAAEEIEPASADDYFLDRLGQ